MRHSPLVLLHGFTGAPESYEVVRQHLRTYASDRIYAPYLAGHGSNVCLEDKANRNGPDRFIDEVDALAADLERQGIDSSRPAVIVGYSLGARMALGLLVAHASSFRAGILIGVNPGLQTEAERRSRRLEDEQRVALLLERGLATFSRQWEQAPIFASQRTLPRATLRRQAALRSGHTPHGLAYSLRHVGLAEMPDYWPLLAGLDVPVHLVVGALDERFRVIAQRMSVQLPRSTLTVVPGTGHNVPLEAPRAVAEILDGLPRTVVP